ncbi:MAG: HAD family hydrolase [Rhodospirillaceae bacterium]
MDRDGVVVRSEIRDNKPYAVRKLKDFRLLPGATKSIIQLKSLGFLIVVVTNQPDIENGLVPAAMVEEMHQKLRQKLAIDDIKLCPHNSHAFCSCRKPEPGMLLEAAGDHEIDISNSYMIGDRLSDVQAGLRAGCHCIFIDRRYAETKGREVGTELVATSLPDAVRKLIAHKSELLRQDAI